MRQADTTTKLRPPHRVRSPRGARLLLALAAALALACLSAPIAFAAGEYEHDLVKAFGPDGTAGTEFDSGARAVALDRGTGAVYVLDGEESLFKFDLQGNPVDFGGASPDVSGNELSGLPVAGASLSAAVSPLTHTVYVTAESTGSGGKKLLAFKPNGEESLFTAGPGAGTNAINTTPALIQGLTVDASGAIWLGLNR